MEVSTKVMGPRPTQAKDPRSLKGSDLEVLVEETHFCIVQKPTNVVVVEGRGVPRPTLHELVMERFGKGALPVHRLDRVTSGCTVFAKTAFGEQAIMEAFRRRHVDKRYLALVEGLPEFNKEMVEVSLLRVDDPKAKRGVVAWQTVDENGQRAVTRLRVLARGKRFSVVEARPETGRMHQIRVHLAYLGFPIVGDKLYGAQVVVDEMDAHAVGLHALAISIPGPKGGRAYAVAPLPELWVRLLDEEGIQIAPLMERALTRFGSKEERNEKRVEAEKSAPRPERKPRRKGAPLPEKEGRQEKSGRSRNGIDDDKKGVRSSRSKGPVKKGKPFKNKSKSKSKSSTGSKSKKGAPKVRGKKR